MNDFTSQLSQSWHESRQPYWDNIYHQYFPNMVSQSLFDNDMTAQKNGIDRMIYMKNGDRVAIDEKVRYETYNDILLEESSSVEYHTPGWIEKDQWVDYISYFFKPTGECNIYPTYILKKAWQQNKHEWKHKYKKVEAVNNGYTTVSYPIPKEILNAAIINASVVYTIIPTASLADEKTIMRNKLKIN